MSLRARACLVTLSLMLAAAGWLHGHGRLHFEGRSARWIQSRALHFALDPRGSDDIQDASAFDALRAAFQSWSSIPGVDLEFHEVASRSNPRWQRTSDHDVIFDEDGSSGWFPPGSGIVALTPLLVSTRVDPATGDLPILDADILFNGREFRFATDGRAGAFDVQAIATHEIGHWLGFDHSACAASSMFPFVAPAQNAMRSLFSDDEAIARTVYPRSPSYPSATAYGMLQRHDGSRVAGAHVVVVDVDGKTIAAQCSERDGSFEIAGLEPGRYGFYADPLDGPVSGAQLALGFDPHLDFARTWLMPPGSIALDANQRTDLGTHRVAQPSSLDLDDLSGALPQVMTGQVTSFEVVARGRALDVGCELELAGGGVVPEGPTRAFGTTVARRFRLDPHASLGARDLCVRNGSGIEAVLTAAIELLAPAPEIERLEPMRGALVGGDIATVHGAHLDAIHDVRLGGEHCEIIAQNETHLTLRIPPGTAGYHQLDLTRSDGAHARLVDAWLYGAEPRIENHFPRAGSTHGGTRVVLSGGPFSARLRGFVDGVPISLRRVSGTALEVQMPPHTIGVADLHLEDPLDPTQDVRATYTYVDLLDPVLIAIDPARGSIRGGTAIEVRGSNLRTGARLLVDCDAVSLRGGSAATDVHVASSAILRAITPAITTMGGVCARIEYDNGQGCWKADAFVAGEVLAANEKHRGHWSGPGEALHYIEWVRGEEIDLSLDLERGSGFDPVLELRDPIGTVIYANQGLERDGFRIRHLIMERTGVYSLHVRGASALSGDYVVQWRSKTRALQNKIRGVTEGTAQSTQTLHLEFEGRAGLELSMQWRWPREIEASAWRLIGPTGEVSLAGLSSRSSSLRPGLWRLRRIALPAAGSYRLELEAPLSPGTSWQAEWRLSGR